MAAEGEAARSCFLGARRVSVGSAHEAGLLACQKGLCLCPRVSAAASIADSRSR